MISFNPKNGQYLKSKVIVHISFSITIKLIQVSVMVSKGKRKIKSWP